MKSPRSQRVIRLPIAVSPPSVKVLTPFAIYECPDNNELVYAVRPDGEPWHLFSDERTHGRNFEVLDGGDLRVLDPGTNDGSSEVGFGCNQLRDTDEFVEECEYCQRMAFPGHDFACEGIRPPYYD